MGKRSSFQYRIFLLLTVLLFADITDSKSSNWKIHLLLHSLYRLHGPVCGNITRNMCKTPVVYKIMVGP